MYHGLGDAVHWFDKPTTVLGNQAAERLPQPSPFEEQMLSTTAAIAQELRLLQLALIRDSRPPEHPPRRNPVAESGHVHPAAVRRAPCAPLRGQGEGRS